MKKEKFYKYVVIASIDNFYTPICNNPLVVCDTKTQAKKLCEDFYKFLKDIQLKILENNYTDDTFTDKELFLKHTIWPMGLNFSNYFSTICDDVLFTANTFTFEKVTYISNT